MKTYNFYNWINKLLNVLVSVFLMLSLLASIYVSCYLLDQKTKIIVFTIVSILFFLILALFRKRIYKVINKFFLLVNRLDKKKMLIIIIITSVVLKLIYSFFISFDPSTANDVSSNYMDLVNKYVDEGILTNTIGTNLFTFTIHLSIFKVLHVPMHIGLYVIVLLAILINFTTFEKIIGKEKSFVATMIYLLMPSTMLLSFCEIPEIFIIFYLSLFLYALEKFIISKDKTEMVINSILFVFVNLMCCKLSFVGYVLIIVVGLMIILCNLNATKRIYITSILVLSVVLSNLTNYAFAYEWRNKENTYFTLLHGSNYESGGRFVENYPTKLVEDYIAKNKLDESHENQEQALQASLMNNYKELISNPSKLIELLTNKFYILFSGSHYAIEMAKYTTDIPNTLFYFLLGTNEVLFIIALFISLITFKRPHNNICISSLELIVIISSVVLLVCEAMNRYSLFLIPFIIYLCIARYNRAKL